MQILPAISVFTGFGAGVVALTMAHRQPEQARQMRGFGVGILAFAAAMAVVFLI